MTISNNVMCITHVVMRGRRRGVRFSAATDTQNGSARVEEDFGVLSHLPVAIVECDPESRLNVWSLERGKCENGTASHGRFVRAGAQDRRQPSCIADASQCRSARLTHDGFAVFGGARNQDRHLVISGRGAFAESPRRHLGDEFVVIVNKMSNRDLGMRSSKFSRGSTYFCVGVMCGTGELVVCQLRQSLQSTQCTDAHHRVVVVQCRTSSGDIALEPGSDNVVATLVEGGLVVLGHDKNFCGNDFKSTVFCDLKSSRR